MGFAWVDWLALAFFLAAWGGYHVAVEVAPVSGRTLNDRMNVYRDRWMSQMLARENRVVDTTINASLQNGTAFFASTSLLAIGGSLTLLRATDDVLQIVAEVPFGLASNRLAWEAKVVGLAVIFVYAFFKFGWSYRLFNYGAILVGAVPAAQHREEPEAKAAAHRAALMNVVAGRHFNRGQRAFFFALAYLGWFVSPVVFMIGTAAVLFAMYRRQFASDAWAALGGEP